MVDKLTAKAQIAIQKPIEIVFDAIVQPEQMKNYFISKGSAELIKGTEVEWEFPEFEGSFPVKVKDLIPNQFLLLDWDPKSQIEIYLESFQDGTTIVKVIESGYQNDEEGLKWLVGQTEGWANFLACMKAWLEYGIQIRKGAFDYLFKK
jgi:uncharacterized protein YndB with AHSA1/START domain